VSEYNHWKNAMCFYYEVLDGHTSNVGIYLPFVLYAVPLSIFLHLY